MPATSSPLDEASNEGLGLRHLDEAPKASQTATEFAQLLSRLETTQRAKPITAGDFLKSATPAQKVKKDIKVPWKKSGGKPLHQPPLADLGQQHFWDTISLDQLSDDFLDMQSTHNDTRGHAKLRKSNPFLARHGSSSASHMRLSPGPNLKSRVRNSLIIRRQQSLPQFPKGVNQVGQGIGFTHNRKTAAFSVKELKPKQLFSTLKKGMGHFASRLFKSTSPQPEPHPDSPDVFCSSPAYSDVPRLHGTQSEVDLSSPIANAFWDSNSPTSTDSPDTIYARLDDEHEQGRGVRRVVRFDTEYSSFTPM